MCLMVDNSNLGVMKCKISISNFLYEIFYIVFNGGWHYQDYIPSPNRKWVSEPKQKVPTRSSYLSSTIKVTVFLIAYIQITKRVKTDCSE